MRLQDVSKRYRRSSWALSAADVDLPPGELIAFVGGNGSGKSTLMRILVGATRPTTGRVLDRPREIGYVPDRFPGDARMSARAYLAHMGRVRGLSMSAATQRVENLVDRLALAGDLDAPLRTLSRGNLQKVALIQALLTRPGFLVLDEPWSGLDTAAHGTLAQMMGETTEAGGTVVFTDHRESVVRANSTRIYHITDGRVTLAEDAPPVEGRREIRLVLTAPLSEQGIPRTIDWHALDGVLVAHTDGEHTTLHVDTTHADQLLLTALLDGWSIVEATQADISPAAPPGSAR